MIEKAIDPIFQGVEDSQGMLFSVEMRPAGVNLHATAEVRKDTATGKFLGQNQVSTFKELDRLPAGQLIYTGVQTSPTLFQTLGGLIQGVTANLDGKEMKDVKQALEQLGKADPKSLVGSASLPPAGVQVWSYAEPAKALAAQIKLIEGLTGGHTYVGGLLKEKPVIKAKARKYGDVEFTSVKLVWDPEKMVEQSGATLTEDQKKAFVESMRKMMGDEAHSWYGSDGKHLLQVTAPDWSAAEKLLDDYSKGQSAIGKVAAFRDVRKELPAEATILAQFDLARYVGVMVNYVKPILPPQAQLPAKYPPAIPKDRLSFAGMAITMLQGRGSFDLYFSTQSLKDTYETFIRPLVPRGI